MHFWETLSTLPSFQIFFLFIALLIAFGFEFINGFHDTANAVTTVIYTRSMKPGVAVVYSGFLNFLGVLLGGTGLAWGIVNLLPVEKLVDSSPQTALMMVIAMLLAAVIWNLGTWYVGLPVSSSHTLIGSIIGVGIAYGLLTEGNLSGVSWGKATEAFLALLVSPIVGFSVAAILLLLLKKMIPNPKLYQEPTPGEAPPGWIRWATIATCGGVSFFHGSNDGQKGMGLLMLVLIGFMPSLYALHPHEKTDVKKVVDVVLAMKERVPADELEKLAKAAAEKNKPTDFEMIETTLAALPNFHELKPDERWSMRQSITHLSKLKIGPDKKPLATKDEVKILDGAVQHVPLWVVVMTALCLGVGTMIGYKRIVVTVAEKIGKSHMTYAQGLVAQLIASITICLATYVKLPVSTTHILSSGVAGTMAANRSGLQGGTLKKIALAWFLTLPICMLMAGLFFAIGKLFVK